VEAVASFTFINRVTDRSWHHRILQLGKSWWILRILQQFYKPWTVWISNCLDACRVHYGTKSISRFYYTAVVLYPSTDVLTFSQKILSLASCAPKPQYPSLRMGHQNGRQPTRACHKRFFNLLRLILWTTSICSRRRYTVVVRRGCLDPVRTLTCMLTVGHSPALMLRLSHLHLCSYGTVTIWLLQKIQSFKHCKRSHTGKYARKPPERYTDQILLGTARKQRHLAFTLIQDW